MYYSGFGSFGVTFGLGSDFSIPKRRSCSKVFYEHHRSPLIPSGDCDTPNVKMTVLPCGSDRAAMVGSPGFEPGTYRLKVRCSTN